MPRKKIKAEPLTNAERQNRFRRRQRKNMSEEQELRASDKLYHELRDILETMPNEQLYVIAPLMRYMKHAQRIYNNMDIEELAKSMEDLDLSDFNLSDYPRATFNRTAEENTALEKEWEEQDEE